MALIYRSTPGWDADARTVESFSNDGAFTFRVEKPIGVACGLNSANNNANYLELDYAFIIDPQYYQIIESGVKKTQRYAVSQGVVYKIERLNEVVRYFVDEVLIYTSLTPSAGTVFGDCSLYAYLDTVVDACILDYETEVVGTESEIPTALTSQIRKAKSLLQDGKTILGEIDYDLQQILSLVEDVEALLTSDPVVLTGVDVLWDSIVGIITALKASYTDFYLIDRLYSLILQVEDIINAGLDLLDVDDILALTQEIIDLINNSEQVVVDEALNVWDSVTDYVDALEAQNTGSTFFDTLKSLSDQVDYLLSIGQGGSPTVSFLIDAILELIDLGDEALLYDVSVGVAPVGPVGAIGSEEPINLGFIGIGPVQAAGTEADINRGPISIGPVGVTGAEGDPNWGAVSVGPLSIWGQEDLLLPEYNAGDAYLNPVAAYGYEGVIDVCYGTAGLGPVAAIGSEGDIAFGGVEIGPLFSGGYSNYRQYLLAEWPPWLMDNRQLLFNAFADLQVPAPILTASANHDDNIRLSVIVPAPILTAYTGAVASLSVPAPVLTSTGTVQVVARAELEVPAPVLTATATNSILASVLLEVPAPILTAATGAYASLKVLAPILTAIGRVEGIARIELAVPAPELTATGTAGSVASVVLEVPAPILTATGIVGAIAQVVLIVPAPILTASAQVSPGVGLPATTVATETTYTVNLTTGAVTTLLLGEFTKLITAHGRLYGLRSGALVRLDGNLDGAATIPATIRFAPQTFGTNRAKRLSTVYFDTREDDGLTLDVIPDENTSWRYQTVTDNAKAYGTHKVKIGRGLKFHTAGLMLYNRNGGRMDIGGMELIVEPLSRRPKT